MKVPAYCKCHAKRPVFTCAPKKLDTFSSSRPGQTVTKYCACHAILRVRLKAANQKSQRTVNAMQNEPCSLAHWKNQTLSVPPAQVIPSQSIAPATQKQRVHLRSLAHLKGVHLRTWNMALFRCTSDTTFLGAQASLAPHFQSLC